MMTMNIFKGALELGVYLHVYTIYIFYIKFRLHTVVLLLCSALLSLAYYVHFEILLTAKAIRYASVAHRDCQFQPLRTALAATTQYIDCDFHRQRLLTFHSRNDGSAHSLHYHLHL